MPHSHTSYVLRSRIECIKWTWFERVNGVWNSILCQYEQGKLHWTKSTEKSLSCPSHVVRSRANLQVSNHRNESTVSLKEVSPLWWNPVAGDGVFVKCASLFQCLALQSLFCQPAAGWHTANTIGDPRSTWCRTRGSHLVCLTDRTQNSRSSTQWQEEVCFHHYYLSELHARKFQLNFWKTSIIILITQSCAA